MRGLLVKRFLRLGLLYSRFLRPTRTKTISNGRRNRAAGLVAAGLAVALGGCANRGLTSGPPTAPGNGTWMAVTLATVLAGAVLAALIVLPVLRPGGSLVGSWVLGLQAGGVAVASAIIIGAAVRSEQLLDPAPDAPRAASLLRLSGIDGRNSGFFHLIVLVTLVVGGLLVALFALAARFAADVDPIERSLATGLLGVEVLGSVVAWVLLALGFRHAGFVLPALALPFLVIATRAAWPRHSEPVPIPGAPQ